jgi:restriction endonuclease S subunit
MTSKLTIGDFVSLQRGTTYKGNLVGKPGPALLGLGAIIPGGGFRIADFKSYGGDCPDKLMLYPGDLFVSLKGATKQGDMIGSIARVPQKIKSGRLTQDTVKLVFHKENKEIEPYLYWLLRTPQYREYCAGRATGSAVVALSREDFLSFPVPTADASRLRLSQLFDEIEEKIDVLRDMNGSLEAIAQSVFNSWFVNFDPVKAKAEGREPEGMDTATAALFPSEFDESESGVIPRGWRTTNLGAVAIYLNRGISPNYVDGGGILVLNQKCVRGGIVDPTKGRRHDSVKKTVDGRLLEAGDILVNSTGVGTLGRVAQLLQFEEATIVDSHVTVVRANLTQVSGNYLGLDLMRREREIEALGTGTTGQTELSRGHLAALTLSLPPKAIIEAFDSIIVPLRQRISLNLAQVRTLGSLRDALLPKLISGQIRVPAAEALVKSAI